MPETKLKPCPFCGREAITKISVLRGTAYDDIRFSICCPSCSIRQYRDLGICDSFDKAEEAMGKAIKAWNRRAENETD